MAMVAAPLHSRAQPPSISLSTAQAAHPQQPRLRKQAFLQNRSTDPWRIDFLVGITGAVMGVIFALISPPQLNFPTDFAVMWCVVAGIVFPLAHYAPAPHIRIGLQLLFVALAASSLTVALR